MLELSQNEHCTYYLDMHLVVKRTGSLALPASKLYTIVEIFSNPLITQSQVKIKHLNHLWLATCQLFTKIRDVNKV